MLSEPDPPPPSNSATTTTAVTLLAQFSQQGPKLVATGAVGNARQGRSVSISADGNTAIVGGDTDNNGAGAAWVWMRSGGAWTRGPKLVGSGAIVSTFGSGQGTGVAISADGNTAMVGGWNDTGTWVFTRSGNVWTQQGSKLIPSGVSGFGFAGQGSSVALSADGNTALIGGPLNNAFSHGESGAWVWTRSGGVWTQQGPILVGSGSVGDARQGSSVAISADGNTAISGGPDDNGGTGAAWVWRRSGGVWTQQGPKLVGSDLEPVPAHGFNGQQGFSVSLSADGNTALVGAPSDYGPVYPSDNTGAARIWTRSGGVWTRQGPKLVGPGGVNASTVQGFSVSLSADGNTAFVGGVSGDSQTSTALVWTRIGGVWTQEGTRLVGSGAVGSGNSQQPGVSVSLSADANTAIVGGWNDNSGVGAAWVFTASALTCPIAPLTSFANLATKYCSDLIITQQLEADPIRTDLYSQSMQTGIAAFQARVRAAGFTGTFLTGTFRTRAYQAHLREVWDKNRPVAPPPECSEISSHFIDHAFGGKPGSPDSTTPGATQHIVGRAIDINIKGIRAAGIDTKPGGQLDQIAAQGPFGFHRTDPGGDPVHFEALFVPVQSPQQCPGTSSDAEARSTSDAISGAAVAPVTVKVLEQSINGHPVYSYRVVNGSSHPVVSVTIGYDQPNDNPELAVPPLGWDYYDGLPQSSAASPTGWSASVVPTEESSYLQLTWASADSGHFIAPGQSSDGFSVVLPNADNSYKNSHWTIVLADGTVYSASLEPLNAITGDTVQFSQAVYTVNKNSGHATITVTRAGSTANSATVHFATSDGTAQQPTNYTSASGSLIFAPAETSKSFTVQIINNVYLEPDQTVNLNLSNASGLSLGNLSFATLVINHNSLSSSPAQLILETSDPAPEGAAALDSLLFLRDPFSVVNGANLLNLGVDRNTRVIVFVMNLQLAQGETSSSVVVNLIDSNNQSHDVVVEDVRLVPNLDFTQVIFRLPDNLPVGTCTIKVKAHGQVSNAGTIKIRI